MGAVARAAGVVPTPAFRPLLAWTVVVLTAFVAVLGVVVDANVGGGARVVASLPETTLPLPFAVMGALIVSRRPQNRIGWMFIVIGGLAGLSGAVSHYAHASAWFVDAAWPGTVWAAWLAGWLVEVPAVLLLVFLPLTFPTGHLVSRRWRPVAWFSVLAAALFITSGLVAPDTLTAGAVSFPSPTHIVGGEVPVEALNLAASIALLCVIVAAMWSLRLRYQRASGIERLQIKWLLFATLFMVSAIAILIPTHRAITISEFLFDVVYAVVAWAFPVAVGVLLRHPKGR